MKQRILFVGLGMMGFPMATLLARAGYPLTVMDLDAARAAGFARDHGATVLPDDRDDPLDIDVLITMLPNSAIVEEVLLGKDGESGLAPRLPRGAIVVDMSSSEPLRTRALAERLSASGVALIDAPVSGGVKRAVDGSLSIMMGGDATALERCRDILACMGKTLTHVGPAGAGHATKALNNYVSAAGLVAAVEALHIGRAFGLDPAVMNEVFNTSTGRNNTTENKVAQFMLNGAYNSGFALQLMVKDLATAMRLAEDLGMEPELGATCYRLWDEAGRSLDGPADHTEMYRLLD